MIPKPRTFITPALTLLINGCIILPREQVPPQPVPVAATLYTEKIQTAPLSDTSLCVSIAGSRVAMGGVYMDLLITEQRAPAEPLATRNAVELEQFAQNLARSVSLMDKPSRFIEMQRADGSAAELRPMQRAEDLMIVLPGTCILRANQPPLTDAGMTADGRRAVIQTLMLRTSRSLEPGGYRLRLCGENPAAWLDAGVTFVTDWVSIDVGSESPASHSES
jgi:hypothetical protein